MQLQDLLGSVYRHDGMGPNEYNCWGLVRAGMAGMFGLPLLPAYGHIHPDDKAGLTAAWGEVGQVFEECPAEAGAMACCYEGQVLVHVGLVVERRGALWVIHTNESTGPVQTALKQFNRWAQQVRYYRYKGVPA